MKKFSVRSALSGAVAGILNGLLGAGGGMVLVPLLERQVEQRQLFPTAVAVMLPLSAVSAGVYALHGSLPLKQALPFLLGGCLGAIPAGLLCKRIPVAVLRRIFALFLLWGGVRLLL